MKTPIYHTWCDRIDAGYFTRGQCSQWAQCIVPLALGMPEHGRRTLLTRDEAQALRDRLTERGSVRLFSNDEAAGLAWLKKYGTKTLGIPAELVADFDHFEFRGHVYHTNEWDGPRHDFPIWHVVTKSGRDFTYHREPWQAETGSPGAWHYAKAAPQTMVAP